MSLLQVRQLAKAYGTLRAVDEVSFEVRAGEIYGLLGPNGAGKTTAISMICGLLQPDAGEVLIDGTPFQQDPNRARRLMGVVPQELALYEELSARENLEFWGRLAGLDRGSARARSRELLQLLAIEERSRQPVKAYSGGMKRRVNLGIALMHQPRLLLLDEPTVGIDPQARANLLQTIGRLCAAGTGIVYTTHYLDEAEQLCSRVGIIDRGRLLAEGTVPELCERVGRDRVFILEGEFAGANPTGWPGFLDEFRLLQQTDSQIVVASSRTGDPSEGLRRLLELPAQIGNVTVKRPSLNDVFLQLTGRELRE